MSNFYDLIAHVVEVIKKRPIFFFIILVASVGLYSFFFALFTIPIPWSGGVLGFYRMVPPTPFEYFYMFFSSLVSALIVTLTFHRTPVKISIEEEKSLKKVTSIKGKLSSILGLTTGVFGAVCPACLGINFLLLGNVFTAQLAFLIPYILWVQLGGIVLLLLGLYFIAKSSYERKCISCSLKKIGEEDESDRNNQGKDFASKKLFSGILILIVLALLIFQVSYVFSSNGVKNNKFTRNGKIINTNIELKKTISEVTPPQGFIIQAKWGDIVSKMIKTGVLDPVKLENVLRKRYGEQMRPEWRAILAGKNEKLKINSDNAVFMMYILWTLSKSNSNPILTNSPFAKYFKHYNIGVGKAGYGNVDLLKLTAKQQQVAKAVAENANRPCCNNSTAAPDCSHGYSALGLVELMASQNFSKQEIFKAFVKFNSFWFPETYVNNALYFKLAKGQDWSAVNKEIIAGKKYSSLSGAYRVKNYLRTNFGR